MKLLQYLFLLTLCSLVGCSGKSSSTTDSTGADASSGSKPAFTLAWSEYPSWSVFDVAHEQGLIDGAKGKTGPIEDKWNVDIVLKQTDYDTCLTLYGSSQTDAVCITNMDALSPSLSRDSVAVLPTSTSVGADACIAAGIDDVDGLKGKTTYGLEMSVSQYCFERNLELLGKDVADYPFKNMDPAQAAQVMQQGQKGIDSIIVWNPFVLQTLRTRDGTKVLFDSSTIPEEIIDMVVIGKDSLAKEGGEDFAAAVIDCYYEINQRMADPETSDKTLVQIGEKFSSLGLEDMKLVVKQTQFYGTADEAIGLFGKDEFRSKTMPMVVDFSKSHGIVDNEPKIGFDDESAQLNFTTKFIEMVKGQ